MVKYIVVFSEMGKKVEHDYYGKSFKTREEAEKTLKNDPVMKNTLFKKYNKITGSKYRIKAIHDKRQPPQAYAFFKIKKFRF